MQIYIDRIKKINDTEFLIYDESFKEIFIGKAKNNLSYKLGEICLTNKLTSSVYCLRQTKLLRKILSNIPILSMFIECPYHYYKDDIYQGKTKQMYACIQIKIYENTYWLRLHTGCKISIWINDKQVGIVSKIKSSELKNDRFSILFSREIDSEIVALFTIFALVIFLDNYGMPEVRHTYVPFDKYSASDWEPGE